MEEPRGTSWESGRDQAPAVFDNNRADHRAVTRFRNGIENGRWRGRAGRAITGH